MRRLYLMMALAVLIQACAALSLDGLRQPTSAPAPSATATVSLTPLDTFTPSITPTVTSSPTIVHIPTQDPNLPTATFVPIPIFIGKFTATPLTPPTPIRPGPGFLSVEVTEKKIYWGSCKPNKTRIIAKVENPEAVFSVIIFAQVKNAFKEDYTPWTTGNTMQNHWNGTFTYMLTANTTEGHNHYKNSWIRFQLVATDDAGEVIGRTKIYMEEIALSPCLGL